MFASDRVHWESPASRDEKPDPMVPAAR
jgi:hypothetical protein